MFIIKYCIYLYYEQQYKEINLFILSMFKNFCYCCENDYIINCSYLIYYCNFILIKIFILIIYYIIEFFIIFFPAYIAQLTCHVLLFSAYIAQLTCYILLFSAYIAQLICYFLLFSAYIIQLIFCFIFSLSLIADLLFIFKFNYIDIGLLCTIILNIKDSTFILVL